MAKTSISVPKGSNSSNLPLSRSRLTLKTFISAKSFFYIGKIIGEQSKDPSH
jgi:hypothetical protein